MLGAPSSSPSAAVIGGGPAGLMAAEVLARAGVAVTVYERMPSLGRKFLMAGRGGLNLTHSEPEPGFRSRYGMGEPFLAQHLDRFSPQALRDWADALGAETFVGSSGRVFPRGLKASPLLRAWITRLQSLGVAFRTRWTWRGWDERGALTFDTPDGRAVQPVDATVLALGGASWPRLGSDGGWVSLLADQTTTFAPANSGACVNWSSGFRERFQGEPLKAIALTLGDRTARGEAMVSAYGLEGGAIYALSADLRRAVADGSARLDIDLRPTMSLAALATKLARPRQGQSTSTFLRKAARLSPVEIGLLREAYGPHLAVESEPLARQIKAVPLLVSGVQGLDRAISSAGGVRLDEVDAHLMLRARPGVFLAGEMLDWEAPTGGYLLQACFATGVAAGEGAVEWLKRAGVLS